MPKQEASTDAALPELRPFGLRSAASLVAFFLATALGCSSGEASSPSPEDATTGAVGGAGGRSGGAGGAAAGGRGGSAGDPPDAGVGCSPLSCLDGCKKFQWPLVTPCDTTAIERGYSAPSVIAGCGYFILLTTGPFGQFEQFIYDATTGDLVGQRALRPQATPSFVCSDSRPDARRAATPGKPWDASCPDARVCYTCSMGDATASYTCLGDGGLYPWSPGDAGALP